VGQESNVEPLEEETLTLDPDVWRNIGNVSRSTGQLSRQLRTSILLHDKEPDIAVFLGFYQKSYDGLQECAVA